MPALRPLLIAALLLAACADRTGLPGNQGREPAHKPMLVQLLDEWFVQVDGQRLPREQFLYELRVKGRAWRAQGLAPPTLRLAAPRQPALQRLWQQFLRQLQLAGIQEVKVESGVGA